MDHFTSESEILYEEYEKFIPFRFLATMFVEEESVIIISLN